MGQGANKQRLARRRDAARARAVVYLDAAGRAISSRGKSAYRDGLNLDLSSPHACVECAVSVCGALRGECGVAGMREQRAREVVGRDKRKMRVAERTGDAGEGGHMDWASASNRKRRPRSSFDAPANHTTATAPMPSIRSTRPLSRSRSHPLRRPDSVHRTHPTQHPRCLHLHPLRPDTTLACRSTLGCSPISIKSSPSAPREVPQALAFTPPSGVPCRPSCSAVRSRLLTAQFSSPPVRGLDRGTFSPFPAPKITAHPLRFR